MSLNESVSNSIKNFNELVSEIDEHADDSAYFYKLSQHAEWIAHGIERVHSRYYVAFVEDGPDDDFVRIWYPLGFMTAEKAYKILNEMLVSDDSEPWNDSGIKEVSKEELNRYYDLIDWQELYDRLHGNRCKLHDILPKDFINELKKKIDSLREELGLKYRWEHVSSKY